MSKNNKGICRDCGKSHFWELISHVIMKTSQRCPDCGGILDPDADMVKKIRKAKSFLGLRR